MHRDLNKRIHDMTKCVEALDAQQAQLATLSLVVEATIQKAHALIGALMEPAVEPAEEPENNGISDNEPCIHPVDDRMNAATMGSEHKFYCGACDEIIDPSIVSREQLLGKEV